MRTLVLFPLVVLLFACSGKEDKPAPDTLAGPRKLPTLIFLDSISPSGDSVFRTIAAHQFIAHTGDTFSTELLNGKVYVADFFFARCEGICPKMTKQLTRVQERYKNDDRVALVSYTVDPESDTVEALAAYAKDYGVTKGKWWLLTGEKKAIYDLARYNYMLPVDDGDGGELDFIHSEQLVLIDPNRHIRGYYDGTDSIAVETLMKDIGLLLQEFNTLKK